MTLPGPLATRSLRAARLVVAASVVCAPIASALLLAADGASIWPTLLALAAGLMARAAAPASTVPLLVVLALGPLWQLGTGLLTGSVDIQRLMPWLAALGGWLAWPTETPWRVTGAWQVGVVSWALVLAVAWPVTALRELDFTLRTIGVPTPNGSFGLTPHLAGAFVALTAQAQLVALLLFDWAWGATPALRQRAWLALAPGVALGCALAIWQMVDPAFLSGQPWIGLNRATGPFYDANAMGALAALIAAALAGPGLRPAGIPAVVWSSAWAVLALAGVAASGSRTGLAALVVSAVVATLVVLRPRGRVAAVLVLAMLVFATVRFSMTQDETTEGHAFGRLAGTLRRVIAGGGAGVLDVAWRRDGYGPASMAVIADHPWVGVGPGALGNVISDYGQAALGLRLPPDNAQNWWRQQLAELGVIGGFGPVLCSVLALLAVHRSWRRTRAGAARAAPLVVLGLMGLVSPPTQHPVIQVLVGLLVARAVAPEDEAPAGAPGPAWAGWLAWPLAIGCGLGLAVEGWTAFRPAHRAARFHFAYNYGLFEPVQTPLGDGRRAARHSVAVFRPEHRVLVVGVVLPHADIATAPVVVTVSDDHGVVCRQERRDHEVFECALTIADGRWPMVEVDVSRAWHTDAGVEQSALLSGRYER